MMNGNIECWKLYVICNGIDWKSMPHWDIMCFNTLFFVTYEYSFVTMPWCKSNKKLVFNYQIRHCWAFYIFNNKHWFKCAMLFYLNSRDDKWFSINNIYNIKKIPISYLYVEIWWRSYQCNTCSNDESIKFNKGVSIITNFNLMDIYINKNMVPT
jgi:hypothetical protein